jgi:hypothetical protein
MPTTIIDNKYATLWYHPETKIVHHQFHQPIGGQSFREVLDKGLEAFQEFSAQKWLSDDRGNSALSPEDSDWAINNWSPRVIDAGWKYWAVVMPEKVIGQMNMQRFIKMYSERDVSVQVFSDPDEAMRWLEAQ